MMDQYKNETAQIHVPKALIEKTKAAVREEEARIRKEQTGRMPVPQAVYADYAVYQKKYSWRKWSYPLTAVAAVVILLSVSLAIKGIRTGRFMGDQAVADKVMLTEEAPAADVGEMSGAATGNVSEEMSGAAVDEMIKETENAATDAEAGEMDGAATGNMMEDMESAEAASKEMEDTGGVMAEAASGKIENSRSNEAEAPAADYAEEEVQRDMMDSSTEKKEMKPFRSAKGGYVEIEAVKEKPAFYNDSAAEDIVYEDLTFRVMKEEKGWMAYVETADGTAYVINGTFEELDVFLKEGYEKLEKTGKIRS